MDKYRHLLFHLVGSLPGERPYHHPPNTWKSTGDTWVSASLRKHSIKLSRTPPLCCYLRFLFVNKGFPTLAAHESVFWCLPQGKIQGFINPALKREALLIIIEIHGAPTAPSMKRTVLDTLYRVVKARGKHSILGVYLRHLFTGSSHTNIFKFPLQAFRVNQDLFFSICPRCRQQIFGWKMWKSTQELLGRHLTVACFFWTIKPSLPRWKTLMWKGDVGCKQLQPHERI